MVAVNIHTRDADKPKAWLKEVGVQKLAYYADPTARTFQDLKSIGRAFGMPTTLLVDAHGCEIATIAGPAEWASEDAIRLFMRRSANRQGLDSSALILRSDIDILADASRNIGEAGNILLGSVEDLHDGCRVIGIHAQHLGSERHLHAAHLSVGQRGGER